MPSDTLPLEPPEYLASEWNTNQEEKSKSPLVRETKRSWKDSEYIVSQQELDSSLQLDFLSSGVLHEEFLTDDEGVLWHCSLGQKPTLAEPHTMIPRVLSLVHSIYGHPRIAHTTLLIKEKFSWQP